jgi:hypothetical protein
MMNINNEELIILNVQVLTFQVMYVDLKSKVFYTMLSPAEAHRICRAMF